MATLRPAAYVGVASRCNAACSKLTCSESARMVGPLRQQSRTFRTSRIQRLDEDTDLSTLRKWDKMFEKLGLNTYKETFKQNLMTDRQLRQKAAVKRTKVFRAAAAESGIPFQKTEEEYNAFLKAKAAQRGVTAPEKAKPTSSPKGESVQVDSTKMVGAATAAATSAVDWDTSSDEATNGNHGNDSGERPLSPKDLHKQFQSPGYDVDPDMYDEDGYPIFDQSKTELAYEAAGKGAWYRELEQWAEDMDPKDAKRIYEEVWAEEAARKKGIEGKGQDSALGDGAESETGEMHEYGKDLEEVGASEDEAMKYREQYSYEEGEHDVSDGENKEKERLERKRLRAEARAKEAMEAKKEEMLGEEEDDFDIENDENMIEVEGSGDEDIGFSEDEQDEEAEHDLIEDHDFHPDLDMRLIETKRVVNQTGGGKIQSFVSIVAVGNGAGEA
ncbi:hypothetical protein SARC_06555 [Sphaeroforma arctica JP610]|uniref:S5 DRBM domain-containing protein n=1 Tax=Sphaeroforma arctica JP610 TaxID=667725 RepID=A0A0L0FX39_9EUKA|nr:hypothetical protein SARC_06555 [Sphaeroforma arctica JP610]KNC81106.1 hypothetical protein SARC_06555 [Sphaeroforma arctica JP610]|eukprot:XP_014155008.1 hypothetical protein SARC_06555 [Sphaeroforma arctica JP610]